MFSGMARHPGLRYTASKRLQSYEMEWKHIFSNNSSAGEDKLSYGLND